MDYTTFSTQELLGLMIGRRAANRLYRGTLGALFAPKAPETVTHHKLLAARELVKRWLNEELRHMPALSAPKLVVEYLQIHFGGREHESFVVLFLNSQNQLIAAEELFRGTLSQTSVYTREVVKRALQLNAAAIIFSHNHPSGIAEPSRADETLTRGLTEALALVDVRVLDHVVIAGPQAVSFAERGLI